MNLDPRSLVLLVLGAALLASRGSSQSTLPPGQVDRFVDAPPLWYAGDAHEMIQLCAGAGGVFPPDRPLADVVAEMQAKRLSVSSVLVLVTGNISCGKYLTSYAPRVTGVEDPITAGLPDYVLQFGCEVVGGSDPGCAYPAWGHVAALNIRDAAYLMGADDPGQNLDFFHTQPGAIAGYAHVSWPVGLRQPEDFPPIARSLTRLYPLLAPSDVALGRVDFLSTPDVPHRATKISPDPWWGLWYKLLNAGFDVAMTGGTVAQCYNQLGTLDARTWVEIGSEPLTYDKWAAGIADGRTVIADGVADFIEFRVDGAGPGGDRYVSSGAPVVLEATLRTGGPRDTTLELVRCGEVIASEPVHLSGRGEHTLRLELRPSESVWFAARTKRVHTGAVRVFVDNTPITDPATADYLDAYQDQLVSDLDALATICTNCSKPSCLPCIELAKWVGTSEAEIRGDLAESKEYYQALAAYERRLPGEAVRFGRSSPSCTGPIGIGLANRVRGGGEVTVTCINAPPDSLGVLAVSVSGLSRPVHYLGADIWVGLNPLPPFVPLRSTAGGFGRVTLSVPPTLVPTEAYLQYFWSNARACPGLPPWSASEALRVTYRRSNYPGK